MIITCPKCCTSDQVVELGTQYIFDDDGNEKEVPSYICNYCKEKYGKKTQFYLEIDQEVKFPYNQIFVNRKREEFYKEPYLAPTSIGNMKL